MNWLVIGLRQLDEALTIRVFELRIPLETYHSGGSPQPRLDCGRGSLWIRQKGKSFVAVNKHFGT